MLGGGVVYQIWVLYHHTGGDYRFTPHNYVTCKNVMSRRVVMVARGVIYDIRHPRQEEALSLAQSPRDFRRW